ncbi:hemolysin family protein [Actinomadura sp. HBU206391]|uniref:hemolysin family protein n=1 Tax=Actinomadura sp. HBU206391 TaxID=2731692 RepID=UPI00164FDE1C|nr:hemolysin family protein [Actinomadura sp. HBU206391]MBC6461427.1 HlyC/CorC family transporter [Actinomadura sp. HBU206391]
MILDVVFLAAALGLIGANGVFVAAEFSLVTVERSQVQRLADEGDRGAKGILTAVRRLSFQLSGAQLGITITSLLLGVMTEPAIAHLLAPLISALPAGSDRAADAAAIAAALVIATVAQMVLGELVPKNAALASPLTVARFATPPQRAFSIVFGPLIRAFNAGANGIVRWLGVEPQDELASARSPDELGLLVRLSAEAGTLQPTTAAMLHRALRFGDKLAAEAMTPRVDCIVVDASASVAELLEIADRSGHLRFPVRDDDEDHGAEGGWGEAAGVKGVAGVAGAFAVPEPDRATTCVADIVLAPVLVPGTLGLGTVLERLRAARTEMAIVVDEYGGFAGIVTTEDLAEELVGEMADEYDLPDEESAEPVSTRLAPGESTTVPGGLSADEVEERTGFVMPEGPYETLAGLVLARLGHLPVAGERAVVDGWELVVKVMERHRVEQVTVTAPARTEEWS